MRRRRAATETVLRESEPAAGFEPASCAVIVPARACLVGKEGFILARIGCGGEEFGYGSEDLRCSAEVFGSFAKDIHFDTGKILLSTEDLFLWEETRGVDPGEFLSVVAEILTASASRTCIGDEFLWQRASRRTSVAEFLCAAGEFKSNEGDRRSPESALRCMIGVRSAVFSLKKDDRVRRSSAVCRLETANLTPIRLTCQARGVGFAVSSLQVNAVASGRDPLSADWKLQT